MQVPPSISSTLTPDVDGAREVVRGALSGGRTQLTEAESKAILSAYGIPVGRPTPRWIRSKRRKSRSASDFLWRWP